MKTYVGIDLGTTNSVVCTYDGKETHVLKSPAQNDVTPSAIYVDRRGRRFLGRKAFEMAPGNEKNSATLFKRFLGTDKTFFAGENGTGMTPGTVRGKQGGGAGVPYSRSSAASTAGGDREG